jgi:predicted dehydrogenase
MSKTSRRSFLARAALAPTAVSLFARAAKAAPSERVSLCIVGVRGRGSSLAQNLAALPDVQITHTCDVNEPLLGPFAKRISEIQHSDPKPVQDLRRVLEDKTVDGIVVATPDHWHALATIWGCQAGKHVYVEKPISHNAFEGRQMVAAARRYNRVVQVGTQSRSVPHYREAMELLHAGRIGKVQLAKA